VLTVNVRNLLILINLGHKILGAHDTHHEVRGTLDEVRGELGVMYIVHILQDE